MSPNNNQHPILAGGERLRIPTEYVGGGGPKFHPHTLQQAYDQLAPQLRALGATIRGLAEEYRGPEVVLQATLLPNYLAASQFPEQLLSDTGLEAIGSWSTVAPYILRSRTLEAPTKILLLAGTDAAVAALEQAADTTPIDGGVWTQLRKFSEIRLPSPEDVFIPPADPEETGELITWEAVLHPSLFSVRPLRRQAELEEAEVLRKLLALVQREGGEINLDFMRVAGGLRFMPILLTRTGASRLARFNPLRSIRPMPKLRPVTIPVLRGARRSQAFTPPREDGAETDQRVAIFDGGVDPASPFARTTVRQMELTNEASNSDYVEHGTVVTNAVLYGYRQPGSQPVPRPYVHVDHYRVLPVPQSERFDTDLYWLLDQIERTVRAGQYRMVILALGPDEPVEDGRAPHRWTAVLDEIAYEKDVLFVVASGNCGERDSASGLDRVQAPADMANGLGVGSCVTLDPSQVLQRAPYSSRGPGRAGARIQPIGLCFGGTDRNPFVGIGSRGRAYEGCGTSFAAPLAAHGLTGVLAMLGSDRAIPALARAIAVHHAIRRSKGHRVEDHGYGRLLESYDTIWSSQPDSVTVLYEDTIARNEQIILPLPVPDTVQTADRVQLTISLCYTSAVDPSDPVDYTAAGVELVFRPHERRYMFRRSGEDSDEVKVDMSDSDLVTQLLANGYEPSAKPIADGLTPFRTEQGRREDGKWETSLKIRKAKRGAALYRPALELRYLARSAGVLLRGETVPDLRYRMIVTIRVPGDDNLYASVLSDYPVLTPITTRIRLRL